VSIVNTDCKNAQGIQLIPGDAMKRLCLRILIPVNPAREWLDQPLTEAVVVIKDGDLDRAPQQYDCRRSDQKFRFEQPVK